MSESDKPAKFDRSNRTGMTYAKRDTRPPLVVLEADILFGNGKVNQDANFNERNLGLVKLIRENEAEIAIVTPGEMTKNIECHALGRKLESHYILLPIDEISTDEFSQNLLNTTGSLTKADRILYIGSNDEQLKIMQGYKINTLYIAPIQPEHLNPATKNTGGAVASSRGRMHALEERVKKHLGLKAKDVRPK